MEKNIFLAYGDSSVTHVKAFIFLSGRQGKEDKPLLPIDELAKKWKGNQDLSSSGENKEIDVPGFKTLVFKANQTSQKVNFYNPSENDCLFKLTLYADDKQLWESGYIQPNDGYYDIEINNSLDVGEYTGKLLYQCYKDDGTQLNSAVVTFKMIVKEQEHEKSFCSYAFCMCVGGWFYYSICTRNGIFWRWWIW